MSAALHDGAVTPAHLRYYDTVPRNSLCGKGLREILRCMC